MYKLLAIIFLAWSASSLAVSKTPSYEYATKGVVCFKNCLWKVLLDQSNLGGAEVEVVEMVLTAGTETKSHPHGAIEIIYVISGEVGHEVNGKFVMLTPGMLGVVRPGDKVRHTVKGENAKILVVWAPGGEAKRLLDYSSGKPIQ
ncbi:MAG: cupin domain-containing protein [Cellvibrionaceae bacterium]